MAGSELPWLCLCNNHEPDLHSGSLRLPRTDSGVGSGAEHSSCADTPHSTISTAHRQRSCTFDVLELQTFPPEVLQNLHSCITQFRRNLALNFPAQRGSDLGNLSAGQAETGVSCTRGCACGISCSWFAVCLCNPLPALQQHTQLRHCCSSGTGHFWPGFTGAPTLLVPVPCSAP